MSITVSIDLNALKRLEVASALSRLMSALGDGSAPVAVVASAMPHVDEGTRFDRFLEALPDRSRRFIELVRTRGTLTIDEAMGELDITVAKAVGGVTGSIARWAPRSGVTVPYLAVKVRGRRAWRWTGPPAREAASPSPAPTPTPTPSVSAEPVRSLPSYTGGLPDQSQQFLEVLYSRGELKMPEVLALFDLPRPRSVGGITEPINRAAKASGAAAPFETVVGADGHRIWRPTG